MCVTFEALDLPLLWSSISLSPVGAPTVASVGFQLCHSCKFTLDAVGITC